MAAHRMGQSQLPPAILVEKNNKTTFLLFLIPMYLSLLRLAPSLSLFDTIFHKAGSEIILNTQNKHLYIGLLSHLHMNGSTHHNPRNSC